MERLTSLLGDAYAGATAPQVTAAAQAHVHDEDPNTLADHLAQSTTTMDHGATANLGQELLTALTQHLGEAETSTQAAGVTQAAVSNGDAGAVAALIQYCKSNPQIVQSAATAFIDHNPGALASLAPPLISNIIARL